MEESSQATKQAKPKLVTLFEKEWVYFLPRSSHVQTLNAHVFRGAYPFCRDFIVLDTNGNELF